MKHVFNIKVILKSAVFVIIFAVICVGFSFVTSQLGDLKDEEGIKITLEAVKKTAITCYAVEGVYPQSIDYMIENYGLSIDYSRYIVHYEVFASNIMPAVTVLRVPK